MSEKAANAGKLDVQFLEGALDFNAIAGKSISDLYHTEKVEQNIFSNFPQFRTRAQKYVFLSRALKYRTTNKKEERKTKRSVTRRSWVQCLLAVHKTPVQSLW